MVNLSSTPICKLEGITYWVIDSPEAIFDFVNTEVRKEWEVDAKSEHRDPSDDPWLKALSKRKWHLEIMGMSQIKLNPEVINFVDPDRNYVFHKALIEEVQNFDSLSSWAARARFSSRKIWFKIS